MSKDTYEAYIVVIRRVLGVRTAERKHLQVPVDVATGNYERLSDLALREFVNDGIAEQMRREGLADTEAYIAIKCRGYDPDASQIRRNT